MSDNNIVRKQQTGEPGNGGQFAHTQKAEATTIDPWEQLAQAKQAIVAQELKYFDEALREDFPQIASLKYAVDPSGNGPGDTCLVFSDVLDDDGNDISEDIGDELSDLGFDTVSDVTRTEIDSRDYAEDQENATVSRNEFTREWVIEYTWTR